MDRTANRRSRIMGSASNHANATLETTDNIMNESEAMSPLMEPRKRPANHPLSPRSPRDHHHLSMSPIEGNSSMFAFNDDDEEFSQQQQQPQEQQQENTAAGNTAAGADTAGEDESIALARMLMAQEAMDSYAMAADNLKYNAAQYSEEDLQALQAALDDNEEEGEGEGGEQYEMMLRLGDAIGDVKKDRWAIVSEDHIASLETFTFDPSTTKGLGPEDSRRKCMVCQFDYEEKDELRRLPCNHCFHQECVDQWLKSNDCCAYCRKPISNDDK